MSVAPYPEYKDSGVEWIDKIPKAWSAASIKNLARSGEKTFVDGDWIEAPFITDEGVRLIQTGNIGTGRFKEQGFRYITYKSFGELSCTEVDPGDILICRLAEPVGRACIAPNLGCRMITSVDVCILKAAPNVFNKYVVYMLSSAHYLAFMEAQCRGGTRDRVSRSFLGGVRVPLPPLGDQIAIAAFLDQETGKIDALVVEQERLIALLKEKRQAVISQAVTKGLNPNAPMKASGIEWLGQVPAHWEVKRLKYLGEAIIGLTYEPANVTDESNGLLVLRSSNVQGGKITFDDNVYVSSVVPSKLITQVGDILICSRNGSRALIGKNATIDAGAAGLTFGAFMTVFRSQFNGYLSCVFNSPLFEFQSGAFLTSTINQLTVGILNDFEVPFPPSIERDQIASFISRETEKLNTLITEAAQAISLLRERRAALISAAVTGKIDVRSRAPTKQEAA